jgi:hypothetical protein
MAKTDQSKVAYALTFAAVPASALAGATTYQSSKATHIPVMPAKPASETEGVMSYDERLIDAKLEAVEARTESKFAQMMGELRVISAGVTSLAEKVGELKADVGGVKAATAGVKWNIAALGLTLGGLIIAIAAFGTQILDMALTLVNTKP